MSRVHCERCKKDRLNCYTAYNRYPGFNVHDYHTEIPLSEEVGIICRDELEGLSAYVTVNYGWDRVPGRDVDKPQAKVWPFEHWKKLVSLLKSKKPELGIVQVGGSHFPKIPGCDMHFMGRDWEFVKHILKGALVHIDSEGGLQHLSTQLGTRCIVLFGPTPMYYYAYSDNINICANKCKDCYKLDKDFSSCYLRQSHPECMYAIEPAEVLLKVLECCKT